jgi:dsRNA-specific ribonuclease
MCDSKTPVTILQELCVKKKESAPHYEFLGEELVKENEKIFTYRVSCFGQESRGTGKAKRDAKHDAACNVLKKLAHDMPDVHGMKISSSHVLERDNISELLNICVQRNLPKAEFELESASGPSHSPEFKIVCCVATMRRSASHSTKKGAKQLAAQKMLATIQEVSRPLWSSARKITV